MSDKLLYKDGTTATTVIGKLEILTTAVLIRSNRVQYEIAYFKDGEHYSKWVEKYELNFDKESETTTIGYVEQ